MLIPVLLSSCWPRRGWYLLFGQDETVGSPPTRLTQRRHEADRCRHRDSDADRSLDDIEGYLHRHHLLDE